jgi:hypothetical protein
MGLAEQPPEDRFVPHVLTRNRNEAHRSGLVIEYADGHLIGDYGGNGAGMAIMSRPTEQTAVIASNFSRDK